MESVDWARNKCPLSAIICVRISGLFIERFCDTRISSRENIRAFNKKLQNLVYRSILSV